MGRVRHPISSVAIDFAGTEAGSLAWRPGSDASRFAADPRQAPELLARRELRELEEVDRE